jgi:hypothetical protein
MKKMRFMALLLMVGALMVACKKDDAKEWQQFYDFTLDDIKGTYDFSYVSSAFDGLTETSYCHICEDANISVSSYLGSESSIEFKVNCTKATFNKSFTGKPAINEDDAFLLNMSSPNTSEYPDYTLTVYVYKNAKGNIRLHGYARRVYYETVYENGIPVKKVKSMTNYYFDVIKK